MSSIARFCDRLRRWCLTLGCQISRRWKAGLRRLGIERCAYFRLPSRWRDWRLFSGCQRVISGVGLASRLSHTDLGKQGEAVASRFLKRQGLRVVDRGHRDLLGELDLVAVHRPTSTIVFVEVKTRRGDGHGSGLDSVDARKQRQIVRAALGYLKTRRLLDCRVRFDVVAISWPDPALPPEIRHIPHAFTAPVNEG